MNMAQDKRDSRVKILEDKINALDFVRKVTIDPETLAEIDMHVSTYKLLYRNVTGREYR